MRLSMKTLSVLFAFVLLSSPMAFAGKGKGGATEKFVLKAKNAIKAAGEGDWHAQASWAKKCIEKGITTPEVNKWIEQSLKIQETAYTLEVKGDFYAKSNMKDKAIEYYMKSIQTKEVGDFTYSVKTVQEKIMKLKRS
ncbi:MAG: hypothetical protein ACPGJS_11005 [Flammeovirgaceae bacterium]